MGMQVVHWFRRDLRLDDNTALLEALHRGEQVYPPFVLDDDLLGRPDMGGPRVRFLLDCLRSPSADLASAGSRLYLRRGRVAEEEESAAGDPPPEGAKARAPAPAGTASTVSRDTLERYRWE